MLQFHSKKKHHATESNMNLCIIALSGRHLPKLVRLLGKITNNVFVIPIGSISEGLLKLESDMNIWISEVPHEASQNPIMRIVNYIKTQFRILEKVIALRRLATIYIFFVGGEGLLIPILTLKLLGKKALLLIGGVATKIYESRNDPFTVFLSILINLTIFLADKVIVYSRKLINEMKLSKYRDKIIIAHEHFIDFTNFLMKKRIANRSSILGYVGRLSEEKGILKLIEAIPLILKETPDVRLIICGDGCLVDEIEEVIKDRRLEGSVKLMGEIPHEEVPYYLNEIKLLILPSFTEGLPNIVLEAMACGTPVLATPVGAIPDVIKEGKTGFLLKSNDQKHIAERIIELLNKPNLLETVSINAYNYVRENFSYEKTLETWRKVLSEL